MAMMFGLVTIDTLDPERLGGWWREQLDATVVFTEPGEIVMISSEAAGVTLGFHRVPDPTPGKNRIHLDFEATDRQAEVDRLVAAGATVVNTVEWPGADGMTPMVWTVLADPDGNQFCVADHTGDAPA